MLVATGAANKAPRNDIYSTESTCLLQLVLPTRPLEIKFIQQHQLACCNWCCQQGPQIMQHSNRTLMLHWNATEDLGGPNSIHTQRVSWARVFTIEECIWKLEEKEAEKEERRRRKTYVTDLPKPDIMMHFWKSRFLN